MESPPPTSRPVPARGRRGYWLPGAIAMTVLLLMALALGAGDLDHQTPRSLDGPEVAGQVATWLQARQGLEAPPKVLCPASEPIRVGLTFDCSTKRAGVTATVQAVELNSQGQLKLAILGAPSAG